MYCKLKTVPPPTNEKSFLCLCSRLFFLTRMNYLFFCSLYTVVNYSFTADTVVSAGLPGYLVDEDEHEQAPHYSFCELNGQVFWYILSLHTYARCVQTIRAWSNNTCAPRYFYSSLFVQSSSVYSWITILRIENFASEFCRCVLILKILTVVQSTPISKIYFIRVHAATIYHYYFYFCVLMTCKWVE